MEKLVVKQRKLLAFLPKAVSSTILTFQVSPPISPVGKGSSAPIIVSLIPKEAPKKSRNGSFDAREPASPKVSCMGQIKCNKNKRKNKKQALSKSKVASSSPSPPPQAIFAEKVKSKLLKGEKRGHKSYVSNSQTKIADAESVPSFGQTKKFSSARGTLSGFDWKACDLSGEATGLVTDPLYVEKGVKTEKVVVDVNGVKKSRKPKLWNRRTTTRLTPLQL